MAASAKSSVVSFFLATFLAVTIISEARDILIGGNVDAWRVPPTTTDALNIWSSECRFRIGDRLVWTYDSSKDSVLEVSREDYMSCIRANPIAQYKNSTTVVELPRSGPYYFISGAEGACEEGEKLIVVVMARWHRLHSFAPVPAPSPMENEGSALAPTSAASRMTMVARNGGGLLVAMLLVLGMLL